MYIGGVINLIILLQLISLALIFLVGFTIAKKTLHHKNVKFDMVLVLLLFISFYIGVNTSIKIFEYQLTLRYTLVFMLMGMITRRLFCIYIKKPNKSV